MDYLSELKEYRQFVCWRYHEAEGERPTKLPHSPLTHRLASVTDPTTWASYAAAKEAAATNGYAGVGFVLTESDPFFLIDLDCPETSEQKEDHNTIYAAFNTYAEVSPSGKGVHLVGKGSIPAGRKRYHVEVYSDRRYFTLTENALKKKKPASCQKLLTDLWASMGKTGRAAVEHESSPAKLSDDRIIQMAVNAANGDKAQQLLSGDYTLYPSQSEADQALMNILTFYSEDHEQVIRIFRNSPLGKRKKALRDDYLNYTLNRAYDRHLPPLDLSQFHPKQKKFAESKPDKKESDTQSVYAFPPGLVGDIATWLYRSSPRPVKEIALVGAISLMAGICGRCYQISESGLNTYLVVLAESGTGKDSLESGLTRLMRRIREAVPAAMEFIGPGEFASAQALQEYMAETSKCFVSSFGEFSHFLKKIALQPAHRGGGSPSASLRRTILQLYSKSGASEELLPYQAKGKGKSVDAILAPAVSLVGDCTLAEYYKCITADDVRDGLIPRFTVVACHGKFPKFNQNHGKPWPQPRLIEELSSLCAHSLALNAKNTFVSVTEESSVVSKASRRIRYLFDKKRDTAKSELEAVLWTRAYHKVLRFAGLSAVGRNWVKPALNLNDLEWAKGIVINEIETLVCQFVPTGACAAPNNSTQAEAVLEVCKDYCASEWDKIQNYCRRESIQRLHERTIVPYAYIAKRLQPRAAFANAPGGSKKALTDAIQSLQDRGDIQEVPKQALVTQFAFNGRAFVFA